MKSSFEMRGEFIILFQGMSERNQNAARWTGPNGQEVTVLGY